MNLQQSVLPYDYFNEDYLKDYFNHNIRKKKGGGWGNYLPVKFIEEYDYDRNC